MSLKSVLSLAGLGAAAVLAYKVYKKYVGGNSRDYKNKESVGDEYDAWTDDGVLERFWGEHIHHGWFGEDGNDKIDSIPAKEILIDKLMDFGKMKGGGSVKVLDVGCGIGGSSRYIATKLGAKCSTVGVTLSKQQAGRAGHHTAKADLTKQCRFMVADALALPFEDGEFDYIWTLESGEHMPDKQKFISEAHRVLKPGGKIVMATWCHRNQSDGDLSPKEKSSLQFIYDEWALPFFVSMEDYQKIFSDLGMTYKVDDWSKGVAKTWSQAIWDGVYGLPWLISQGPVVFYRTVRDTWAIVHMMRGFRDGYVRYGVAVATKPKA